MPWPDQSDPIPFDYNGDYRVRVDRTELDLLNPDVLHRVVPRDPWEENVTNASLRHRSRDFYFAMRVLQQQLIERDGEAADIVEFAKEHEIAGHATFSFRGRFDPHRRHWEEFRRLLGETLSLTNWADSLKRDITTARLTDPPLQPDRLVPLELPARELEGVPHDERSYYSDLSEDEFMIGSFLPGGYRDEWTDCMKALPFPVRRTRPTEPPLEHIDGHFTHLFADDAAYQRYRLRWFKYDSECKRATIASFMELWALFTLHLRSKYPYFAEMEQLTPKPEAKESKERWPVAGFAVLMGAFAHFQEKLDTSNRVLNTALTERDDAIEDADKAKARIQELVVACS